MKYLLDGIYHAPHPVQQDIVVGDMAFVSAAHRLALCGPEYDSTPLLVRVEVLEYLEWAEAQVQYTDGYVGMCFLHELRRVPEEEQEAARAIWELQVAGV